MAGKPRLVPPPREVLATAYGELMEHGRLGKRFGVSASTARKWLIDAQIPIPPLTGRNRTATPILTPDPYDIAWTAGIYEGEGSVACSRGKVVQARVSQKDRWLLERLLMLFGGSIVVHRSTGGFIGDRRVMGEGAYLWCLGGGRGRAFLQVIYPWLSPRRREQIDKAFRSELAA